MKSRHTYTWLALDALEVDPQPHVPASLVASIRSFGLLQPVLAVPVDGPLGSSRWRVVKGQRRVAAATAAGLRGVPALVAEPQAPGVVAAWRLSCAREGELDLTDQVALFAELADAGWEVPRIMAATGASRSEVTTFIAMSRAGGLPVGEPDWAEKYLGAEQEHVPVSSLVPTGGARDSKRGVVGQSAHTAMRQVRRPAGAARARTGPVVTGHAQMVVEVEGSNVGQWFGPAHPHAAAAAALCESLDHDPEVAQVACGVCWEETIVASVTAPQVPRPSRDEVDEAAVSRALSGDTSIELTAAERRRVIWSLLEAGWLACDIAKHVGCSTKTVYRATKAKQSAGG